MYYIFLAVGSRKITNCSRVLMPGIFFTHDKENLGNIHPQNKA